MTQTAPLSQAVEEYLEAIHHFHALGEEPSTSGLAAHLSVKPASVTGMLKRLRELGLITYHRYGRVAFTPAGEQQAWEVVRRHRLAERLLTDVLGMPLEQAHEEACRLEHALSAEVESRIAAHLGKPDSCPHGHPLTPRADRTIPLSAAPLNRPVTIARLNNESPEVIRHLAEMGLLPEVTLTVTARTPVSDTVTLDIAGRSVTIGRSLAATIRVARPARSA